MPATRCLSYMRVLILNWNFYLSFIRACKDCILRLLDKDERTRLGSRSGASEVKQHKWFGKINWGLLRNTRPPVRVIPIDYVLS